MGRTSGGVRDMRWQSPADMVALAGTPTAIVTNDFPQWELDDGDGVCGIYIVPHGYGRAEPHLVFYDALAGAGNFTMRLRIKSLGFLTNVTTAAGYDQSVQASVHPQNAVVPMVFPSLPVTGLTYAWRLDRTVDTLADPIRILGINWETVG